jgi:hypothetical protein
MISTSTYGHLSMHDHSSKPVNFYLRFLCCLMAQMLQSEDGHWAGDYGGPHFLLPGLIFVWYFNYSPFLDDYVLTGISAKSLLLC